MTKSFSINQNKGFHLTLPNGLCVSTQFGGGNYCENRSSEINPQLTEGKQSNNAEIAFYWTGEGESNHWATQEVFKAARIKSPGDDVAGWIDIKTWLRLLKAAQTLKRKA